MLLSPDFETFAKRDIQIEYPFNSIFKRLLNLSDTGKDFISALLFKWCLSISSEDFYEVAWCLNKCVGFFPFEFCVSFYNVSSASTYEVPERFKNQGTQSLSWYVK